MAQVIIWAVIDRDGNVVGAYTNRLSAVKRVVYLDDKEKFDIRNKYPNIPGGKLKDIKDRFFIGPFDVVKCIGEIKI